MKDDLIKFIKGFIITIVVIWGIILINDLFQDWRFRTQLNKEFRMGPNDTIVRSLYFIDTFKLDTIK